MTLGPSLSSLETKAAEVTARVIAAQALPPAWQEEKAILASFMAVQLVRSKATMATFDDLFDRMEGFYRAQGATEKFFQHNPLVVSKENARKAHYAAMFTRTESCHSVTPTAIVDGTLTISCTMPHSIATSLPLQDRVALLADQKRSWCEIGLLIVRVEQEHAWRNDAQTFTEWLVGFSMQLGLGQSNLWRYRASVLYGLELLRMDLSFPDVQIIAALNKTSADILEVLSKISRVAPPRVSAKLAQDVFEQKVSRTELRAIWNVFKSGLENQGTARPATRVQNQDTKRSGKADRLQWASLLSALLRAGPEWIRPGKSIAGYKLINDISWTGVDGAAMAIDAVIIVKWAGTNDVSLHGIVQRASIGAFIANSQISHYCDDVWLLSDTHTLDGGLPDEIGMICIDLKGVTVVKKASSSGNENNVACLAKFLLGKML